MLLVWQDLADELGIPWYTYFSVSPLFAVTIVEHPKIMKAGLCPGYPGPHDNERLPIAVPELTLVPGLSHICVTDLPEEFTGCASFFQRVSDRTIRATGLLLNVSEELDALVGAVEGLRTLLDSSRVLPIGPAIQHPQCGFQYSHTPDDTANSCLTWLDSQKSKSVLYIAFGTLGTMGIKETMELATGLEASGVSFLWALKTGSKTLADFLPPGFIERTQERGFIETGWAPQSKILLHPSTGGFLSHCGWNSTLEGICAGVPFICWPLAADQPINARFVLNYS
jgi:hydroquinone glucosyltransferase